MTTLSVICDRAQPLSLHVSGPFLGATDPVVYTEQTADFTAVANDVATGGTNTGAYEINSAAGPVLATLPAAPEDGDKVLFKVTDNTNQIDVVGTIANVTGNLIISTAAFLNNPVLFTWDATNSYWTATT